MHGGDQGRRHADRARRDGGHPRGEVAGLAVGQVDDRGALAVQQVQQHVPQPAVERRRQRVRADPAGREAERRPSAARNVARLRVGDLDALGPAGGAGGVDDVRALVARPARTGSGAVAGRRPSMPTRRTPAGSDAGRDPVRQQQLHARVAQDEVDPVGRVPVVDRHRGRAEPPHREQAGIVSRERPLPTPTGGSARHAALGEHTGDRAGPAGRARRSRGCRPPRRTAVAVGVCVAHRSRAANTRLAPGLSSLRSPISRRVLIPDPVLSQRKWAGGNGSGGGREGLGGPVQQL